MQIRTRLTLQFMVVVTLLIIATFTVIYLSSANYRENELYRRLDNKAQTSADLFVTVDLIDSTMLRLFDITQKDKLPYENVSIYDSANREVYANNDSLDVAVTTQLLDEVRENGVKKFRQGAREVLGTVYSDGLHKFVVFAAAEDVYGNNKLQNLRNTLFVLFLASVSIIAVAGWMYAGKTLSPLSQVLDDVKKLDPEQLDGRLSRGRHEDEIGKLIETFNMLLERIEKAVGLQRLFITGASHELKNPLTSITSQLQVALLRERTSAEYRSLIHSVLEDIRTLNKTTNDLMEFARLSHEKHIAREQVRIDDIVWEVTENLHRSKPEYRIDVRMDHLPADANSLVVHGHPELLKIGVMNLADNACKFSPDKQCTVALSLTAGKIQLDVIDRGPGIPEHVLPYIFEPFYRGDSTSSTRGHGVGLAFTRIIFNLHDAKLDVFTKPGTGSRFSVIFEQPAGHV